MRPESRPGFPTVYRISESDRLMVTSTVASRIGRHNSVRLLSLVFFVSGAAGLAFEIVWLHQCGLVFGNSVRATSIVLSCVMAGLALGAALVGWYGWRIGRLLRAYAALEATVAVTGVALTYGLAGLIGVIAPLARHLPETSWSTSLVRFVAAFALLAVPTTAMGATLPVLVVALSRGGYGFGRALGRLYGWNTLGAVTGVVSAEVVLIGRFGVAGTAWIAASMNLSAAAAALWLSRSVGEIGHVRESTPLAMRSPRHVWRLLVCAWLAGGGLMALEIVWFRFLSMFVVSSTLTASLMLAVVLAAIGIGGLTASAWLHRRPEAISYLPAIAFATALISVESYATFRFLATGSWAAEWSRILWFAGALTFVTSVLSAVIFTLLGEAITRCGVAETRAAGWLTLANTTGAMCGPLVAAFVLLPMLGMERAFIVLALLYGVVGLLAIPDSRPRLWTPAGVALAGAALVAVVATVRFPFGLMAENYFARAAQLYAVDGSRVVATREGPSETIFLMQKQWMGQPVYDRLVTNGFSMSGTHLTGKRYMRFFVYWPMLVHQAPLRRILVVCYGVGVTVGAVTDVKSAESIDVVEISPDVVAMSDIIYPPDARPLRDPRVRLHIEDGRYFLQATDERFDLITGEPPPPLTPGAVNLYTREYFQLIHNRLAEGGIATYWLPVARRGEYDVNAIIGAFCDVFEDCSLWNGTPFDWMLVGTRHATGPVSATNFSSAWNDPVVWPHLREIGFEVPQQIGASFLGDASYLRELTAGSPPLTDNYPHRLRPRPAKLSLEVAPDNVEANLTGFLSGVVDPLRARDAFARSAFIRRLWPRQLVIETLPFFDDQRMINRVMSEGANPLGHIKELHALLTETSLRRLPLWELGSDDVQQEIVAAGDDGSGMVAYVLGVRTLVARNYRAAAGYFAESERRGLRLTTSRPLLVYSLCLSGNLAEARQAARGVVPHDADERLFWSFLTSTFGVGPEVNHP
jgi:predicted membrane-bound spermidine synthase